jgi:hypothetical protein
MPYGMTAILTRRRLDEGVAHNDDVTAMRPRRLASMR